MKPAPQPAQRVEIYFILYLAALVFLIPDGTGVGTGENPVTSVRGVSDFQLQPEKAVLTVRLLRDTAGNYTINERDTSVLIRWQGMVEDVRFDYIVEDQQTRQELHVSDGQPAPSRMFSIFPRPEISAAEFRWKPPITDLVPRSFLVRVIATATPIISNGGSFEDYKAMASLRLRAEARFLLTQSVEERLPGQTIIVNMPVERSAVNPSSRIGGTNSFGDLWLQPQRQQINVPPGEAWQNRIAVGGADIKMDLAGAPSLLVEGDDGIERSVSVRSDLDRREIVVEGRAPLTGKSTIRVTVKRRDGIMAEASFVVTAQPVPNVDAPEIAYPGLIYLIKPNLPHMSGRDVLMLLKDGDREIHRSRGEEISITPQISDTGRAYTIERFVDSKKIGLTHRIRIVSFPAPEIVNVQRSGQGGRQRLVTVMFYGEKNRPSLEVVEGNAKSPRKLYGNVRPADRNEKPAIRFLEEFEISPQQNDRPFTFSMRASDNRGMASNIRQVTD